MATELTTTESESDAGEWRMEKMPIHGYRILDENGSEIVRDIYSEETAIAIVTNYRLAALVPEMVSSLCFFKDVAFAHHVNDRHRPEAFSDCNHMVCRLACKTWNETTAALANAASEGVG